MGVGALFIYFKLQFLLYFFHQHLSPVSSSTSTQITLLN